MSGERERVRLGVVRELRRGCDLRVAREGVGVDVAGGVAGEGWKRRRSK